MRKLPANGVVITGLGMCSSLGNAAIACAAARCGISQGREIEYAVFTCGDGTDATVIGHPVATAAGFQRTGKLVNLGAAALVDLLEAYDLRSLGVDGTGLYICLQKNPPDARRICEMITSISSFPLPESAWNHFSEGHVGFVRAFGAALTALRTGRFRRCLVGGIDSLLNASLVEPLLSDGRLKTPDKPDGMQPGEGAAFVLLERVDSAENRRAKALANACGVAMGINLAEAISSLSEAVPDDLWVLSDHNGEHHRAAEFGTVFARISGRGPTPSDVRTYFPAMCFGETGAASAAIAACLVARAFAREYAPAPTALILSSSDDDVHGALYLKKPIAQ